MRILHLLSQTELTGAEVYAQNLIQYQVQAHHAVSVISDRIHVPLPTTWTSLSISTNSGWQRLKNIFRLRQILKEQKIEVIHCHSRGAVRHAYWARWGLPIGIVTTLHGRQHFSWSKRFLNIYGEIQIAICENVKRAMQADFRIPGSAIRILRNPVALKSPNPKTRKNQPHIALLGRSSGPKGERFEKIALHCFAKWLELFPGLRISIIAPRPERFSKELQTLVSSLNEKHPLSIQILGHLSDLRNHLSDFDLNLCSGRIAIESLLEGTPVFAIGEHSAPGLVTESSLSECLNSNFGDIGAAELERPLDLEDVDQTIQRFLRELPSSLENQALGLRAKIEKEFDPQSIHSGVLDAYRAALFKRQVPDWIPILMYHKIPDHDLNSRHRIYVEKENFEKHLQFFHQQGFQTITFKDLFDFWNGLRPYNEFPERPLILTFDDGYKDNLINAEPLLKKYGFQAVIYLLGNHAIQENTWDANTGEAPDLLMSLAEKKQLDPSVWEIGSHGFNHLHLTEIPEAQALEEMTQSRLSLKKDFNQEIFSFAYPFGSTNETLSDLAKQAGYAFAVNTDQGGLHLADQPLSLFRVNIFPEDGALQLRKKTASWYRRYFFRKRKR